MEGISCTLIKSPKEKEQFLITASPVISRYVLHFVGIFVLSIR